MKYLFILILFTSLNSFGQGACEFWGEISTEVVKRGSLAACASSANPVVCKIAFSMIACSEDPSCDGVFQQINEKGCNITISAVGNIIKISADAKQDSYDYLQSIYSELHRQISNLYWKQSF